MRLIVLTLSILCLIPALAIAGFLEGTAIHVADGDTITVLDSFKQQHRIRTAGIDAPEKGQARLNSVERKHEGLERKHKVLTREHRVHYGGGET